ncbi:hypothetical protein VRRI112168_17425 [Vreelandella rituensis]
MLTNRGLDRLEANCLGAAQVDHAVDYFIAIAIDDIGACALRVTGNSRACLVLVGVDLEIVFRREPAFPGIADYLRHPLRPRRREQLINVLVLFLQPLVGLAGTDRCLGEQRLAHVKERGVRHFSRGGTIPMAGQVVGVTRADHDAFDATDRHGLLPCDD